MTSHRPRAQYSRLQLADALALIDEAEVRRDKAQIPFVIAAARIILSATLMPEPRDKKEHQAWERAIERADLRISNWGCFACLAESGVALAPRHRADIDRSIAAGRADLAAGRYSGPFDTADEAIASLQHTQRVRGGVKR